MDSSARGILQWLAQLLGADPRRRPLLGPDAEALRLVEDNGIAALLWQALAACGVAQEMDPDLADGLREIRDREAALDLVLGMESDRLVGAFLDAGLPVIALKGLALRAALYRPHGWVRGPGDLDLLLPRDRLSAAASLLAELGWRPAGKYPADLYRGHHHIEPHLHPRLPSVVVDVHWSPVKSPHPYTLDLEEWWRRAVPLEGGAEGLRRLDDLDCLVHLCLQLDHDDSYAGKVRSLFDLAAFARDRRVDGRSLDARAREVGGSREVSRAFGLVRRLLGGTPPPGLPLSDGPRGPAGVLWRRMVERALFRRLRPSRLPAWYVRHAVEVLGREQGTLRAAWALLRPVWSNPRLGGEGFHPEDGLTGRH